MMRQLTRPKGTKKTKQNANTREVNQQTLNMVRESRVAKPVTPMKTHQETEEFEREQVGINKLGLPTASACESWLKYRLDIKANIPASLNISAFIGIPGLDCDLCRCESCKASHDGGLYWIDDQMRQKILARN